MIRWTGEAPVERLRAVRRTAAAREIPMTLERAPWAVRRALGHFGAYREGVGQLVGRLRETFDPRQCSLRVALEGSERDGASCSGRDYGLRSARPLRPLRLLPSRLPHLPRHRRRGRQPARPHRAHARARARRDRRRRPRAWCSTSTPASAAAAASRSAPPASATAGPRGRARTARRQRGGLPPRRAPVLAVFATRALWRPLFAAAPAASARPACRSASPAADGSASGWGCWPRAARRSRRRRGGPRSRSGVTGRRPPIRRRLSRSRRHRRPLPRLCHGHPLRPRPRGHPAHARGQRLPGRRGRRARPAAAPCTSTPATAPAPRRWRAQNLAAFAATDADYIVVNSAGCGALLKDYGHLLGDRAARAFGAQVRDVSELLAAAGPRPGGAAAARRGLRRALPPPARPAGPGRAARRARAPFPGSGSGSSPAPTSAAAAPASTRCCSPRWPARCSTEDRELADGHPVPELVATGNPGCLMQIGAGLRAARLPIGVVHPVELLDWSYQAGGIYSSGYISSCLPPPRST